MLKEYNKENSVDNNFPKNNNQIEQSYNKFSDNTPHAKKSKSVQNISLAMQTWLDRNKWYMNGGDKSDYAFSEFEKMLSEGWRSDDVKSYIESVKIIKPQ